MITRTVTYKGQDIKLTYCLKVLFLFEQIMEKMFSVKTVTDTYMFVWCCLIVADPDYMKGDYSKFIEACEDDPGLFKELSVTALAMLNESNKLNKQTDTDAGDKKKKD